MGRSEKSYLGLYGNVQMQKVFCEYCQQLTLVLKGKTACCVKIVTEQPERWKRESEAEPRRRRPSPGERREILDQQGNLCLYCDREFGSNVLKKNRLIQLRVEWDHIVPYCYSQNNYLYNFVAACQICNGLKGSMMFDSLEQTKVYISTKSEVI